MMRLIVLLCVLGQAVPVLAAEAVISETVLPGTSSLQELLDSESRSVTTWYRGWTIGYAALTVVQGAGYFVFHNDPGQQKEMLVGAAGSLLGMAGMLISPVPDVRRAVRQESDSATALLRGAAAEREGRSILNHVLAAAVPVASAALLYWQWDRAVGAWLNLGAGLAIGAAQIYTQPYGLVSEEEKQAFVMAPILIPHGAGLQLSLILR